MKAFFDESGDIGLGDIFAIGGVAGSLDHWGNFAQEWSAILKHADLDDFHMNEFENRRGYFEGWEEARKRDLLKPLVDLIVGSPVIAFGATFDLAVWNQLSDRMKRRWVDPYLLVFQVVVQILAQISKSVGEGHTISYIFDRKDKFRAKAEDAFNQLRDMPDRSGREHMGEILFRDRPTVPELQAADMFVYELRKYELNQRSGRPRATRWPMKQFAIKEERGQVLRGDVRILVSGIPPT